jgi:hypothetical protein
MQGELNSINVARILHQLTGDVGCAQGHSQGSRAVGVNLVQEIGREPVDPRVNDVRQVWVIEQLKVLGLDTDSIDARVARESIEVGCFAVEGVRQRAGDCPRR